MTAAHDTAGGLLILFVIVLVIVGFRVYRKIVLRRPRSLQQSFDDLWRKRG